MHITYVHVAGVTIYKLWFLKGTVSKGEVGDK